MSALGQKADIAERDRHVCFVPKRDIIQIHATTFLGSVASVFEVMAPIEVCREMPADFDLEKWPQNSTHPLQYFSSVPLKMAINNGFY